MDLTCTQVEMLLSFYFDGELKDNLKYKVEEHLKNCPVCRAKYETLAKLFTGMRESVAELSMKQSFSDSEPEKTVTHPDYKVNMSAYIDNELDNDENIKIKKLTINNKKARKYLEDSYALKHVINSAFEKSKNDMKYDFTKNVLSTLDIENQDYAINPIIKGLTVIASVALFGSIFAAVIIHSGIH